MRLQHRLALVTGASSGIGQATAVALSRRGCRLLLCGRDESRLADVARRTGGEALVADLADPAQTAALGERLAEGPAPDVVVHNAGIGLYGGADAARDDDVARVLTVNALAPMRLTRALLPAMRARGSGRLVFVGSIAGALGVPEEAAYAASKAALATFAASLRGEVARDGIGVLSVLPGVVATEFFDRRGEPYARHFPRPVPAERVAEALVRGLARDRTDVVVPGWLRLPIAMRALAPQSYARMATRWS